MLHFWLMAKINEGMLAHEKWVWQETRLSSPEVWASSISKAWRDSRRASISTSQRRRRKEALFAGWDGLGSGLMRWYSVKKYQQLSVKCFFLKTQIRVYDPSSEKPLYSTSQYHRQKWSKPTQDVCNVPIQIKLKMIFSPFSWMVKSMKGRERIGSSLADQLGPSALVVYTSSFTVS